MFYQPNLKTKKNKEKKNEKKKRRKEKKKVPIIESAILGPLIGLNSSDEDIFFFSSFFSLNFFTQKHATELMDFPEFSSSERMCVRRCVERKNKNFPEIIGTEKEQQNCRIRAMIQ